MSRSPLAVKLVAAAALIVMAAVPWFASGFFVMMCIRVMYFGMLSMSLVFLAGQLGMVSLMQASFFGIAGYFVAILQTRYHLPFPIPPLAGLAAAVVAAALFGLLAIRTKGVYFLMLTLVLGQLTWALASQWASVTKGDTGITNVQAPIVFGYSAEKSQTVFYFFQLTFFLATAWLLNALKRSAFGLMLRGVRDSETRMAMLGYPVAALRYVAFIFAALAAAVGGVFFTYFTRLINPHAVSLTANVETLLAGILGGINSLFGAVLGTVILKTLDVVLSGVTKRYLLIMGSMFLLVIMFAPQGLVGSTRKYWHGLVNRVLDLFGPKVGRPGTKASIETETTNSSPNH
ncbi:MAG: branched-chain amino acid ABC transporter permease [Desulfobacteraceae bacterium]|nr:MAG: branched-chain amino acid ABC transporter permease [Desulfobacteraceae bacterium]